MDPIPKHPVYETGIWILRSMDPRQISTDPKYIPPKYPTDSSIHGSNTRAPVDPIEFLFDARGACIKNSNTHGYLPVTRPAARRCRIIAALVLARVVWPGQEGGSASVARGGGHARHIRPRNGAEPLSVGGRVPSRV
jgi:hypothetical protein